MAHEARGRTPGGEPGGRGEGRGRNGPAARSLREDLLWAASPRRRELRHGGQHREAGNRRGGRAGRGRSAQTQLALRIAAPSRSAALAAYLSLACWHRPTRSEEHTSELQSRRDLVCRLLLEKKKKIQERHHKMSVLGEAQSERGHCAYPRIFA